MPTGCVKWFDPVKGYGFIAPDEGGKDAFVHIRSLERSGLAELTEGQHVMYEMEKGRDGRMSAANISVL